MTMSRYSTTVGCGVHTLTVGPRLPGRRMARRGPMSISPPGVHPPWASGFRPRRLARAASLTVEDSWGAARPPACHGMAQMQLQVGCTHSGRNEGRTRTRTRTPKYCAVSKKPPYTERRPPRHGASVRTPPGESCRYLLNTIEQTQPGHWHGTGFCSVMEGPRLSIACHRS